MQPFIFLFSFSRLQLIAVKALKTLLVGLSFVAAGSASAFDPDIASIEDPTVIERFPQTRISTVETAEQALKEVRAARSKMKELAEYSKRRCNENIFVNSCIEDVRKAEMRQERRLQAIETQARRIVREDETRRAQERQRQRDEKAAKAPAAVKKPEVRDAAGAQRRAAEAKEAHDKRMKSLEERRREAQQRKALEEKNRKAFEKKAAEYEKREAERQKRLEKKVEKNSGAKGQ